MESLCELPTDEDYSSTPGTSGLTTPGPSASTTPGPSGSQTPAVPVHDSPTQGSIFIIHHF